MFGLNTFQLYFELILNKLNDSNFWCGALNYELRIQGSHLRSLLELMFCVLCLDHGENTLLAHWLLKWEGLAVYQRVEIRGLLKTTYGQFGRETFVLI